jgi:peptidoglycan/LPS O-acetylase OafA/YrhL
VFYRLGQSSYALYMVHMPLMTCALFFLRRTSGVGGIAGWTAALVLLLAATLLSVWLYKVFENPARRWLNRHSPFSRADLEPIAGLKAAKT